MRNLQVLGLIGVLVFSSAVFGQEKEKEKPKEVEKSKEVEKPKDNKLSDAFRKSDVFVGFWYHCGIPATQTNNQPADVIDLEFVLANPVDQKLSDDSRSSEKPENIVIITKAKDKIEVITKAIDLDKDTLTYNYTVSGGRIIGVGEKVFWDLSNVKPGTYTITAAVDDGCGFCGKTQTRSIVVKE